MPIRKLNDYRDKSYFDNTIEPTLNNIITANNSVALSKITEENNLPRWNNSEWPGGGGTSGSLLAKEIILDSPLQRVKLTDLDCIASGGYTLFYLIDISAITDVYISLNSCDDGYFSQEFRVNDSSFSASPSNFRAKICRAYDGYVQGRIEIDNFGDNGLIMAHSNSAARDFSSTMEQFTGIHKCIECGNITAIDIWSSFTGGFKVNSSFRLFKRK
jgi:hypothetical protein